MVSVRVLAPDRAFRIRALVEDIVLRFGARHFTLAVPLSTHGLAPHPRRNIPSRLILLKPGLAPAHLARIETVSYLLPITLHYNQCP